LQCSIENKKGTHLLAVRLQKLAIKKTSFDRMSLQQKSWCDRATLDSRPVRSISDTKDMFTLAIFKFNFAAGCDCEIAKFDGRTLAKTAKELRYSNAFYSRKTGF